MRIEIKRHRKRISGLVAAAVAFVLVSAYLVGRFRLRHFPYPDSMLYEVVFNWDGGIKSLRVVNERTGLEEKDRQLRRMIAAEAEKTLPSFVRSLGLSRAQGTLYCYLAGGKEFYAIECQDSAEGTSEIYDPDAKKPLMVAAQKGDVAAIKELIQSGANVNAPDQHSETALMRAARLEDSAALSALVGAGANVNAKDSEGRTALLAAVEARNIRAVKVLIAAGAEVNAANNKGWTALMAAETPEIVRALLAAGANVNATNQEGETALMVAALFDTPAVVKVLLTAHPDVNIRSKDAQTALDLAKSGGRSDVEALLRKAGAVE